MAPVGDEQIIETVIVIVAHGYRGCPTVAHQARLPGNIRECPIAIVLVQTVCSSGRALDGRTTQQKDIEPAIVVVVEERRAAANGFEDVGFSGSTAADDRFPKTRRAGNIREAGVKRQAGWFAPRYRRYITRGNTLRFRAESVESKQRRKPSARPHRKTIPRNSRGFDLLRGGGIGGCIPLYCMLTCMGQPMVVVNGEFTGNSLG